MLIKCDSALLISDVDSFAQKFEVLASDVGVELLVEEDWSNKFRVTQDVVILGTKFLDKINEVYYPKAVVILKPEENPFPLFEKGLTHFIFDYKNQYELMTALYKAENIVIKAKSSKLKDVLKHSVGSKFVQGYYDFDFGLNIFKYKGKQIYLCESTRAYLAEWLLNGHKDNTKRAFSYRLRKKFGADFLKDVDRYGKLKESI